MNRRSLRKLAKKITSRKNRPLIYGLLFTLAAAVTALACGWSYVTDHSVRFNSYRTARGFYRLPPLPVMYNQTTGKELSVREVENYDYGEGTVYEADYSALPPTEEDQLWEQIRAAVQEKRLRAAHDLLNKYLSITADPSVDKGLLQENRNTAYDILDALSALKLGSTEDHIVQYINARYSYQYKDQNLNDLINWAASDKNLIDNWSYLRAAALYSEKQNDAALEAFQNHAAKYPRSEKNEAVLYMIAKLYLEASQRFKKDSCGDRETGNAEIEAPRDCTDENWNLAFKAFRDLMERYPNGRYFNDTRRWLAFLYQEKGDKARAIAEYYGLLGHPTDRSVRLKAKFDLQYVGHEQDDATLDEVEKLIADDADAALAYAYHRIYNHAIDLSYTEYNRWCCYGDEQRKQDQEENKRVKDALDAGNHELRRIARFATAMIKRYPHSKVGGGFVLRVAEAQLELRNYAEAETLTQNALSLGLAGEMRAEALWVKGSAQHQRKDLKAARSTFTQLIAEFPKSKLNEGARRLLAMAAEDQNDLEFALEQYLALGYEHDVAYFVDVLFPTKRLAKFVAARPNIPQHNEFLYALGVRYMRERRWDEARATLRRVHTEKGIDGYLEQDKNSTWYFAKEPGFDDGNGTIIKTSWVMQDLKTIDVIEHYERAVENSRNEEEKAEAMYQLASSYYEADDLAFYNPNIWKQSRVGMLSQLMFSEHERLPGESRVILEHMQVHDPWVRAISMYEDVVKHFPQSKTAKDALYSAAVAHERLSGRNGLWSIAYERGLFAGPRLITYADVKSAYPNYQLPRGTYGWKPSTRTVNGGPGWDPKPKPAPKLTRTQIFERRLKYVSDKFQTLIKPRIDSVTTGVHSLFNGYISIINTFLSWLLGIVCLLGAGYFVLLGVHFRVPLLAAARRLTGPEISTEQLPLEDLPTSDSRVEKVIDESRHRAEL